MKRMIEKMENRSMGKKTAWLVCCAAPFLTTMQVAAQEVNDSVKIQKTETDNSAYTDASSDSRPRDISLGLPTNTVGTVPIFEDGIPVSYYHFQLYPYKSWHGGVSAKSSGQMSPMESAMIYGEIGLYMNGMNREGDDSFHSSINYSANQYGQHKLDVNVRGALGKGWQYSLSTYQNFDPASNHLKVNKYHDRHQFYKGVLSKQLGDRGKMSLVYQYVNYMCITENFGPFVYHLDGSVDPFQGFNLGHDSYLPEDRMLTFMDLKTGEVKSMDITAANRDETHAVTYHLDYRLNNGTNLTVKSRLKAGHSYRSNRNLSSTDQVAADQGYTYADGTPYSGYLQRRYMTHFDAVETTWINNAELSRRQGAHNWRLGTNLWYNHGGTITSSAAFTHEAKADPKTLYFKGQAFYNFNTSSEYYNGDEYRTDLYVKDMWKVNRRLDMDGFLRLEYLHLGGENAAVTGEDQSNRRRSGFNLKEGHLTHFKENFLNGSLGASMNYRLYKGLTATAEYVMTRSHTTLFNYGSVNMPITDPSDTHLIRAGFSYQNSWANVVSQLVYIHQNNMNSRTNVNHVLTKDADGMPAGYTETLTQTAVYGVESLGWTTDAVLKPFKGFNLHLQLTLRNPQYKNYAFSPTFSDGVTEHYDFSGNNITNLHKTEVSVDPSYSFGDWRIWTQFRYVSKRYINKTNSLFFKGRWETFGGVDYQLNKKVKLSLNVVNLLNQKGVSGSIGSADLIEDASGYENYVMAGTFIRPFATELSVKVDF